MKLKIKKDFPFAHRGCDVVLYVKGQEVETEDKDLIDTALTEGWASKVNEKQAPENKAVPQTPANKAADPDFPPADPDRKGVENNPLTEADAAADLAGEPRPE